jgi:hypothetical protein
MQFIPEPPNIYDAQVEYLESSGDQYIDTGLYMNQDSKLILEYQGFTNKYLISGCRNSTTSQGFEFSNGGYGGSTWQDYFIQYGNTYAVLANSCPNDENWHTLEMTNEVYVDGSLIHTFNRAYIGQFTTPLTFLLFAMQSNTYRTLYGYMRIKKAQIYDGNNQLVLDAIAVRKNGVGEMYDRVTGQLLTRQGTFIIGSDIN